MPQEAEGPAFGRKKMTLRKLVLLLGAIGSEDIPKRKGTALAMPQPQERAVTRYWETFGAQQRDKSWPRTFLIWRVRLKLPPTP